MNSTTKLTDMKFYSLLAILFLLLSGNVYSQFTYKIKADSLLVTNDSCNAELNLENHTRNVNGFLYNKGNGRTEFRRGVIKLPGDSLFVIGADTIKISATGGTSYTFRNGLKTSGNVIEWGADTTSYWNYPQYLIRPTIMNQAGYPFQWISGYNNQLHVTNNAYTPFNQTLPLGNYIPLRVSHDLQGFVYLENNFSDPSFYNFPTFGILFGNRASNAQKFNISGQPVTGNITLESLGNGTGASKDIPTFNFGLAGDTISGRVATIIGTGTSKYGVHKLPTLVANYRLSIGGGATPFAEGTTYPYTRFYANASSQPFVWKNLPWNTQTATIDTVLSIDYDGNIRQRQLPQILTASATLDFANTTAGNSTDLTVTVAGAADGDVVSIGVPNATLSAKSCYTAWVSASNTITIRFNNYSSAAINPASGTFKIKVFK